MAAHSDCESSRAAPRSTLLALLTFASAVVVVSTLSMAARVAGVLPGEWSWTHGLMLGAILGGSSSIIIMPAMAQARIDAKIANLVSLESALTDAFCVVGTTALVDLMLSGGGAAQNAGWTLARSFGIGLVVGVISGTVWLLFLKFLHSNEHAYPLTLAALLALYVLVDHLGGSAAFGILTFAVVLGNAKALSEKLGMHGPVELDSSVRRVTDVAPQASGVALPAGAARPDVGGLVAPGEVVAGGGAATIGDRSEKS